MAVSTLLAACLFISTAMAGLPVAVGGQPLPSLAPILEKVTPGVVNISAVTMVRRRSTLLDDPFFRRFFDLPGRKRPQQSLGSGVVLDAKRGYVITNHHVVEGADKIVVTLQDGRTLAARLLGADPDSDLAVIEVKADGLVSVPLGDSNRLRVGDFVVAIGNPFGLSQTVTSGIVSGLGRTGLGIEGYEDFIQTDASINPGNSGGALIDLRGELIGINTAILAPNGGNVGIGFAIPVNMAKAIAWQLIEFGEVRRGQLGVHAQDLTPELMAAFQLRSSQGAVISRVEPGSPAERSGLKPGDVVISANGAPIRNAASLRNAIGLVRTGQTMELVVLRNGKRKTLRATLSRPEIRRLMGGKISRHLDGAEFGEVRREFSRRNGQLGQQTVVAVLAVKRGSAAARTGLRKDDVILSVNRQPVSDLDGLIQAVQGSKALMIKLLRGDATYFILIR
jgi:serine protease Do/serine protease DegQ